MYRLFEKSPINVSGDFVQPGFLRIRTGLLRSLERTMDYHQAHPRIINNQHILVRLLENLNVPLSMDIGMYRDKVADRSLDLAMSLKMTSPLSRGKIFSRSWFFGDGVEEVLLANVDDFDLEILETNWRDASPIRALYHPGTDLNLRVPNGYGAADEGGVSVMSINIPMLACQYRQWRLDRSNDSKTTAQFISAYPIVNILPSILDIAIFNRLTYHYFDVEIPEISNKHPFYLVDWTRDLDPFLTDWLDKVSRRGWDFDTLISLIPTVASKDYHEIIKLPEMAFSSQVQWGVVLSRLSLLMFLIRMNVDTKNQRNGHYLSQIRLFFRSFFSMRGLEQALSPKRGEEVKAIINDGILTYI